MPSLHEFLEKNSRIKNVDLLSTDALTLFNFLVLIVDIKYRDKYGKVLADQRGKGYILNTQSEVLADQVSPVDDGLLGN